MTAQRITGAFAQIVHSPKGGVEGLLVDTDGGPVQLVLAKEDDKGAALVATLKAGQQVVVATQDAAPSGKGVGVHPVRTFEKLVSVDGAAPKKADPAASGYAGKIVRLNFARHGAPNGFVLDTGDFIHVKPDGFAKLKLKVGDAVTADGDAHFLATGGGWAVEATKVNGKALK